MLEAQDAAAAPRPRATTAASMFRAIRRRRRARLLAEGHRDALMETSPVRLRPARMPQSLAAAEIGMVSKLGGAGR